MFRLSRQVEYALMALSDLSESGSALSVNEISQKRGISRNTLSKVMQVLQTSLYIGSKQGVAGGYSITQDLSQKSLYDLLVDFGEIKRLHCSEKEDLCTISKTCNIKTPLQTWQVEFEKFLKRTPISQFTVPTVQLKSGEL